MGGPATYVPKLAASLRERGHQVRIVAGAPPEYRPEASDEWSALTTRVSRGLPLPQRMARFLVSVLRVVRSADVLYVNGLAGPEMAAIVAGRLLGRPVVLKIVGDNAWELALRRGWTTAGIDEFQRLPAGPHVRLVRGLVRRFARLVTKLIVPSDYLGHLVIGWGVAPDSVVVIRNALAVDDLPSPRGRGTGSEGKREARARLALGAGRVVMTCARLYPWKNLEFLIRLVPDLPPDVTLVIVGDGPERERLEREAVATGVPERVYFAGSVSQTAVQQYLQAADVFTLHTRYEGLSHVMLEAMHAGTPIVASDVGGNAEVIESGRNGLLVPLDDRATTLATLRRLLDDPAEGAQLAAAAQADVRAYRWDVLLDRTIATLASVVMSSRHSGTSHGPAR
ncbi:MAG: glycosyltransferase family 4 protein [Chloroflexota bacterium]|nr:glycosyltransferase family 4 protein [Chloroflexota bacterium]